MSSELDVNPINRSQFQVSLQIGLTHEGSVAVSGPIENKILVYGLLEAAKEAIRHFHEQNQKRVQPVSILPPGIQS